MEDKGNAIAFNTNAGAFRSELTNQEVAEYYNNWACGEQGNYDTHMTPERYTGPAQTAKTVAEFFSESERTKVRVLDVAAGTGRIGEELYNRGFRHIDALDPSEGMMQKAKARGVYTIHFLNFIGDDHRVPVDTDYYDAIASSGGLGPGHMPASAMDEMIRIVKPDGSLCLTMRLSDCKTCGLICLTAREDSWQGRPEYQSRMDQLVGAGRWRLESRELIDHYFIMKAAYVFQMIVL